ncbi:MAG: NAD-dependent epimerase/dehydratase family protein [Spirochaetia bacterium]
MAAKRVVVTGGSGKAGRAIVRDLLEHGYEVLNVDLAPPAERLCPFLKADLCKSGEVFESLQGFNAVVHMAATRPPV